MSSLFRGWMKIQWQVSRALATIALLSTLAVGERAEAITIGGPGESNNCIPFG
jgi:hypothetical protein